MPVPRTADFVAMGRVDAQASLARGCLVARPYARDNKSWQAKAYWSGFDEEISRLQNSAVIKPRPRLMFSSRAIFLKPRPGHPCDMVVMGPLYPAKTKGRSRRPGGWTGAA